VTVWRTAPGWPRYQVSNTGFVRSLDMVVGAKSGATAVRKGCLLSAALKSGRYLAVTLTHDSGARRQVFVHDLVAAAFLGPKPEGGQVRHLNDRKTDNRALNLEYGTALDNAADRDINGNTCRGERHGCAVLTAADVLAIRSDRRPAAATAKAFGVSEGHIYQVRARKAWSHL
jgi:hypothetical protein